MPSSQVDEAEWVARTAASVLVGVAAAGFAAVTAASLVAGSRLGLPWLAAVLIAGLLVVSACLLLMGATSEISILRPGLRTPTRIIVAATLLVLLAVPFFTATAAAGANVPVLSDDGVRTNSTGSVLQGEDLRDQRLAARSLRGANLAGADLTGVSLAAADLQSAMLAGADLRRADLSAARLVGADLTGANLVGARLVGADLQGARFVRGSLAPDQVASARNASDIQWVDTGASGVPSGGQPRTDESSSGVGKLAAPVLPMLETLAAGVAEQAVAQLSTVSDIKKGALDVAFKTLGAFGEEFGKGGGRDAEAALKSGLTRLLGRGGQPSPELPEAACTRLTEVLQKQLITRIGKSYPSLDTPQLQLEAAAAAFTIARTLCPALAPLAHGGENLDRTVQEAVAKPVLNAIRRVTVPAHQTASRSYTVRTGDSLWTIAARQSPGSSSAVVDHRWREIYRLNRHRIGNDPNYLRPGTELALPSDTASGSRRQLVVPLGVVPLGVVPLLTSVVIGMRRSRLRPRSVSGAGSTAGGVSAARARPRRRRGTAEPT